MQTTCDACANAAFLVMTLGGQVGQPKDYKVVRCHAHALQLLDTISPESLRAAQFCDPRIQGMAASLMAAVT